MNWFECKVSYEKTMENGLVKRVTEPYLVAALSCTEAETRIIEKIKPYTSGEFAVSSVRGVNYVELFLNDLYACFYKAKVNFIIPDEKTGTERKKKVNLLAQAFSLKEAIGIVKECMKGSMADYEFFGVTETMLMDVFPYQS